MRVAIVGNSGSGKSTLARELGAPALDLDTVAWEPGQIAVARDRSLAKQDIDAFCDSHEAWIVEGCYGDLIEHVLVRRPELVFVDPGEAACIAHCRARPFEPHKYASKEEQDARLEFLVAWVREYYTRDGEMSHAAHRALYDRYDGPKRRVGA